MNFSNIYSLIGGRLVLFNHNINAHIRARARVGLKIWCKIRQSKKILKILKNFVKNACFLIFVVVSCLSTQPMRLI